MKHRAKLALLAIGIIGVVVVALHSFNRKPMHDGNPPVVQTVHSAASLVRAGDPIAGNSLATVTIVDFYDLRCPPCRRMNLRFERLMQSDHKFRYVPVDYPILGKPSLLGTRALFAAHLQHKYRALRRILMRQKPKPTMALLQADAKVAGIDWAALQIAMNGPVVAARLQDNLARGHGLGLKFVPSWYIGHQRIIGSISYAALVKTVDRVEQRQKQTAAILPAVANHKS
jgi:protein-disulfide isomerase